MHRLIVFIIALGIATNCFAVTKTPGHKKPASCSPESQKVRDTQLRIGWYAAPVLKVGEIRDDVKAMIGFRGGLEINRSVYIGLAGYGLPEYRNHDHRGHDHYEYFDHQDEWELGYGGLEVGVITGTPRTGQLSFGVLIGGGATNERLRERDHREEGFFVIEPQVDLSVSLAHNVRLSIGGSYRFVDDLHSLRYTEDDLQGPTFNVSVAVGIF